MLRVQKNKFEITDKMLDYQNMTKDWLLFFSPVKCCSFSSFSLCLVHISVLFQMTNWSNQKFCQWHMNANHFLGFGVCVIVNGRHLIHSSKCWTFLKDHLNEIKIYQFYGELNWRKRSHQESKRKTETEGGRMNRRKHVNWLVK